jgi:16S rRNA (guanine527-N7)-methyltransferase
VTAANAERFRAEAGRLGVELDARQLDRFAQYLDLLRTWNTRVNLTAVDDPAEVYDKHFLDSLSVASWVRGHASLLDVGAGAGLPGLALAIAHPGLRVTLVESTAKKCAFLRTVAYQLGLGVDVRDGRIEELALPPFEAAISRATFAPAVWLERAQELVTEGGSVFVMSGREPVPVASPPLVLVRALPYQLPGGELRNAGWYRRERST